MSVETKLLAEVIKSVHRRLRKELNQTCDPESVWLKHCNDETLLKEYANAMHSLATKHWEQLSSTEPLTSRINWTKSFLLNYYHRGGIEKERKRSKLEIQWPEMKIDKKIKVLDVGSCYNPFCEFPELDVLAIDLCPALESVYPCDFLQVAVGEKTVISNNRRTSSLAANHFHCVVFSFLLEYFPSPSQRWTCCKKAQQLLVEEGVLVIITPDSKAAHSNAQIMRSWREALAQIGLKRIKYEKLPHAHCMAFRKTQIVLDSLKNDQELASMMSIPQDFHHNVDQEESNHYEPFTEEELVEGFSHLPLLDDD